MAPSPALVHLGSRLLNFRHFDFGAGSAHGYRWVDLKHFRLPAGADDGELLAALIAHPQFRDTYDGAGVWEEGTRHGQWWLEHITADSYRPVGAGAAVGLVRSWAAQHGPLPGDLAARLEQEVYLPIRAASSVHLLGPLPGTARHDYGPIHTEFTELVVADRAAGTLTLLVAADD